MSDGMNAMRIQPKVSVHQPSEALLAEASSAEKTAAVWERKAAQMQEDAGQLLADADALREQAALNRLAAAKLEVAS